MPPPPPHPAPQLRFRVVSVRADWKPLPSTSGIRSSNDHFHHTLEQSNYNSQMTQIDQAKASKLSRGAGKQAIPQATRHAMDRWTGRIADREQRASSQSEAEQIFPFQHGILLATAYIDRLTRNKLQVICTQDQWSNFHCPAKIYQTINKHIKI